MDKTTESTLPRPTEYPVTTVPLHYCCARVWLSAVAASCMHAD